MTPALLWDDALDFGRLVAAQYPTSRRGNSPTIAEFHAAAYSREGDLVQDVVQHLRISGCCLVRRMCSEGTLNAMEEEIRPYIAATRKAETKQDAINLPSIETVTGLLSKSRTYASSVAGNKVWHGICEYFLASQPTKSRQGEETHSSASPPELSSTMAFSAGPGTRAQDVHRGDNTHHVQRPAAQRYVLGRDTTLSLSVAGTPCTKQNGAIRIIPGSHLWDYTIAPLSYTDFPEQFAHAEMMPGDALFLLGSVYHGAGSNTTTHEEQLVYASFATRSHLRQEESHINERLGEYRGADAKSSMGCGIQDM
ncbi:hypothetical protein P153DRAFT_395502 [Dothidotthia symphoricarpi CBS 119687]|uniref:PhyH-domain-containing protein n=1 Tax=Dothidotthia symphoricarpi CBS 119687 TaxID=1392245 RepID=A0A6A6AHS8_9PLEO|nr:uncharacterized protein P153DRAFT_395502 [Dothidotthia symphoricarpi CBS 119687]KAF2131116.1 hypothetical protein P153DRAFT_395502 [Dothidotthia symphoricarpi CBS 119687]